MFTFADELKWYEPGLETIEESLSGNTEKDLIELIQTLVGAKESTGSTVEEVSEGTQLSIDDTAEEPSL